MPAETATVPVTTKGEQTRQAILDAAVARFGRDGYRSTSVANIARDAGLSGTAAYAYFADKETLFFAAVDEDAAGVIEEGVPSVLDGSADVGELQQTLIFTLLDAVERHPLARRLLAGLEPDVTDRVLEIPALEELRTAVADRLRAEQRDGNVRSDVDPGAMANGLVAIVISLLMSMVQVGGRAAELYGDDVAAVFGAALQHP